MSEVVQYSSDTELRITLSSAAKNHLLHYLNQEKKYKGVRLSVKKTGCSGFSYVIDFVVDFNDTDIIESINDDYNLHIDRASYPYLKGIAIDYVRQGLNSKFIFTNPNQTGQCGCGESFTVEETS